MNQVHAYYTGSVQGVGFRFVAKDFAQKLKLVGWVRNLTSGQVELLAEGDKKSLEKLLSDLSSHFKDQITDTNIEWGKPCKKFLDYRVK